MTTTQTRSTVPTLVQQATVLGMYESVRVFLVAQADTFISNENVKGVINHISGGISHSLTLTNVQTPSDELKIGVRLLSQSSWNPVSGFGDVYSGDIAGPMGIPSAIGHPHTGNIIPHAVERHAVTAGALTAPWRHHLMRSSGTRTNSNGSRRGKTPRPSPK